MHFRLFSPLRLVGALLVLSFSFATPAWSIVVSAPVNATLSIIIPGSDPFNLAGSGNVSVDTDSGAISVPQGLVTVSSPLTVPVTTTTAIDSIAGTQLSNHAGTFWTGGANVPGELCPPGPDSACVAGSGFGGTMAMSGMINVHVIADILVIPLDLGLGGVGVGGSTTTTGFTFDAAPWTTGVAGVQTASGTFLMSGTNNLGSLSGQITLVTPIFLEALGVVTPVFGALTLDFATVPEPSSGLLFAVAGFAGLFVLRRRRR